MNVVTGPQHTHWPAACSDASAGPPAPGSTPLSASDRHRIDLHAALIAAGVPPMPGDAWAVRQIAALDSATVGAVVAWLETGRR